MSGRSTVSVYAVRHDGSTGALVGAGVLVDPRLVLVAPPLASRLAGGEHLRLRLGIAATAPAPEAVEVLDVARTTVSKGAGGVLVGLELAAPARSPLDVVAGLEDAQDADALRAVGLAAVAGRAGSTAPGSTARGAAPPPDAAPARQMMAAQRSPWCVWMGWGCPKR